MFVRNRLFAAFSILFLSGCAAITAPEGGPRDEKKPQLVSTKPAPGTTNFKDKTIQLKFDEPIRTKDLNKELIITPNNGNEYTTTIENETLNLEFSKPLEENTTYFLNFRNGVEDVTEGNKAPETTLTFSTGSFLDTASVSGKVMDYITKAPENNLTVALYKENDTATIRKNKPYYFSRTNADGSFTIQNIKAGNYWIYAHQDRNDNQTYDQENEKIGYLPNPISVNPKADSIILQTVWIDTKKPFVLTTENFTDQNTLVYNEGIQKITFQTVENPPKATSMLFMGDETGKRINIYPENGKLPASIIALSLDSAGNQGLDTVKFKLANKPAIPAKLYFKTDRTELVSGIPNKIKLTFAVPINVTGNKPYLLVEDTTTKITPLYPEAYQLNPTKTELTLTYTPKAKNLVNLTLDTTQILAINGKPLQKQSQQFTITRRATTGSVSGTVKTNFTNYTIELLDEKNIVINSAQNLKRLNYKNLQPGNYQIRVKVDENNDGQWNLGDKELKKAPEKLYKYPKPINVRANWEIEDIDLVF